MSYEIDYYNCEPSDFYQERDSEIIAGLKDLINEEIPVSRKYHKIIRILEKYIDDEDVSDLLEYLI